MVLWRTVGIIVAIIILIVILYKVTRKTPEKHLSKARKAHKLGEKYFNIGEDDLARDYYQEAEKHRKKAEEIDNVV
ncbi:hypothetical protein J4430_03055 [Candidatus Woesearchaeota archaeon]|nr:hypothetical protein [Candidatus Woesearchaeota archaeon]